MRSPAAPISPGRESVFEPKADNSNPGTMHDRNGAQRAKEPAHDVLRPDGENGESQKAVAYRHEVEEEDGSRQVHRYSG